MGASGRIILRLIVVTSLAVLAAARLALLDNNVSGEEAVAIVESGFAAVALYFGIGFVTPSEPRLNVEQDE